MKFAYVLISNEGDFYTEECLISIVSLKKHNPDAEVIILSDDRTVEGLKGIRSEILKVANRVIREKFDENASGVLRSRLLKVNVRNYIDGRFVFIDCDTVVCESLDGLDNIDCELGMVLDGHCTLIDHYKGDFMRKNAEALSISAGYKDKHFNSGFMFISDTPTVREFFKRWAECYKKFYKKGYVTDQTSMNGVNAEMGGVITELDGSWNNQSLCGIQYLSDAKVIHYLGYKPDNEQSIYFNTPPYALCNSEIFSEMRIARKITEEVEEIINKPKRAFKTSFVVSRDSVGFDVYFSNHFRFMKYYYVKFHRLYMFFDRAYGKVFKMITGRN